MSEHLTRPARKHLSSSSGISNKTVITHGEIIPSAGPTVGIISPWLITVLLDNPNNRIKENIPNLLFLLLKSFLSVNLLCFFFCHCFDQSNLYTKTI